MAETSQASHATGGADFRGAVRHYYLTSLKRFAKYFVIFAPMWPLVVVFELDYLYLLAIVGILGSAFLVVLFYVRVSQIWKCSRIFRTYPLEFRSPVEKVHLERPITLFLRLGRQGGNSPTMRAKDPLGHAGWPTGIENGVWFAGDDLFGGVALVPNSGELLLMRPQEWKSMSQQREDAGTERISKARRAGISHPPRGSDTSYATDGTDFRGAVRHYYLTSLKRFAKYFAIFAPIWPLVVVSKLDYLVPLLVISIPGTALTIILFYGRVAQIWKCARIFRTYPLEFRSPVEKVHLERPATLFLRLGGQGEKSPTMRAKDPIGSAGWPTGIENGVWFAGDDLFGGVALVPNSGELLLMRPREWKSMSQQREDAGTERISKARRAGIKRPVAQ